MVLIPCFIIGSLLLPPLKQHLQQYGLYCWQVISGHRLNTLNGQAAAEPLGASALIERQLLEFLRKSEADLNSRASLKIARAELAALIDRWNQNHPSRLINDTIRFSELVLRNLTGFGPIEPLLEDANIWEISINGSKDIFVKSHDAPPRRHHETFHDEQHLERVLSRILETSVGSTRQLDPSLGVQDAQLPDGTRIHIVHPELTQNFSFAVSIRKFAKHSLNSIEDFVNIGSLSPQAGDFLFRSVASGATILISGAPGSGKTTLLNALADALSDHKRVVIIEETPEISISKPDRVQLHTRVNRPGRVEISLRALVKASLRMSSDVLIVGEVRDDESLPLLLSLSTGIQGMSTIHGSSCKDALARLRLLVQLSLDAGVPIWAVNQIIANSVDLVVQLRRVGTSVVVEEVIAIEESSKDLDFGFVTTEIFAFNPVEWRLKFSGHNPLKLSHLKVQKELTDALAHLQASLTSPLDLEEAIL
ncbi:MAG: CpaF family protein [Actinomycetota bacterium]|nr:MAG: CpaF family protein [Actinomycetota bacterium]